MSKSHSHSDSLKRGVITVSAAFTLLAAAAPSQAVTTGPVQTPRIAVGSFDPPFGVDIPNLGFKGTFQLSISQSCDPGAAGGYVFTSSSCTITLDALTLNFYNSTLNPTGDANIGGGYVQTYTLGSTGSSYPNAFPANYIEGAYYNANDQFVGFDTEDSNPFRVNAYDSGNGTSGVAYTGDMLLFFKSGHQPGSVPGDPAFLVDCNTPLTPTRPGAAPAPCSRTTYVRSNGARVTINGISEDIAGVPEPETFPLALIGLAALTANRWRRRLPFTEDRLSKR